MPVPIYEWPVKMNNGASIRALDEWMRHDDITGTLGGKCDAAKGYGKQLRVRWCVGECGFARYSIDCTSRPESRRNSILLAETRNNAFMQLRCFPHSNRSYAGFLIYFSGTFRLRNLALQMPLARLTSARDYKFPRNRIESKFSIIIKKEVFFLMWIQTFCFLLIKFGFFWISGLYWEFLQFLWLFKTWRVKNVITKSEFSLSLTLFSLIELNLLVFARQLNWCNIRNELIVSPPPTQFFVISRIQSKKFLEKWWIIFNWKIKNA